ncbi:hypothetical protein [Paenibacillus mucilaginosus]|uniref:hypothetical protein n=1 Tax=Paenibacillus mucilaginosus TaxID=61624 RepID=UPI00031492F0|nr:hypothetical protein [Paenibacillus mucilaginosus]
MKQGKRLCLHLGMMKLAAATLLFTSSLGVGPDVTAAAAGGESALKHNGTPAKPPMGPGKVL